MHADRVEMSSADARDMRALCSGDEQGFQRVVRRHQKAIMAYCYRLTGDVGTAQDVAQEVFLTLWSERKKYSEQGKLGHYLIRIARLRSLAQLKKTRASKRLRDRAVELPSRHTSPTYEDDAAVHAALAQIGSKHRDLLILRHFEGFDLAEIQSITGLRIGTIKSRLHRAMDALRRELDDGE